MEDSDSSTRIRSIIKHILSFITAHICNNILTHLIIDICISFLATDNLFIISWNIVHFGIYWKLNKKASFIPKDIGLRISFCLLFTIIPYITAWMISFYLERGLRRIANWIQCRRDTPPWIHLVLVPLLTLFIISKYLLLHKVLSLLSVLKS